MFWLDEISDERRDELIDYIAFRAVRYQVDVPAAAFLELYRPLSFIASQGVHFFAPVADLLFGHPYASELAFLMQDRSNIDRLNDRIEELVNLQKKGVDIWKMDPGTPKPREEMEKESPEEKKD